MSTPPPKRPIQAEHAPTLLDTGVGTVVFFLGGVLLLIGIGAGIYSIVHYALPSLKTAFEERRPQPQQPMPNGVEPVSVIPTRPAVEPMVVPVQPEYLSPEEQLRAERAKLQLLRPEKDDATRLAEIRRWFGSDGESLPPVDPVESELMEEAIQSVFDSTPRSFSFDGNCLDYQAAQSRIQNLLPRDTWPQIEQAFKPYYDIDSAALPIRVKSIDEQSGGQIRIVYCTLGSGVEVPFRFWLVRRDQWKVFDLENLENGLSLCELYAMEMTLDAWCPTIRSRIHPLLSGGYPLPNHWDDFSQFAESLPRCQLDYYLMKKYFVGAKLSRPNEETMQWLDRIQSPDRMLQPYLVRAQAALDDMDYANVLRFTQLYLDRLPRVVGRPYLLRSDAYAAMGDLTKSTEEMRTYLQISTPTSDVKDFLVDRSKNPTWKPHVEPLLKEFGITGYSYPLPPPEETERLFTDGSLGTYTEFREAFTTHLIRKAGSPQKGDFVKARYPAVNTMYQSYRYPFKCFTQFPENAQHRKTPAVVFLHGGFAYGDEDWDMVLPYLKAGFAVMTPILRGENYQEGEFSLYYNEVVDVLNATEVFLRDSRIDYDRVYIAGHSAGGTLALLCAMSSKRYRGAASFAGTMDCRLVEQAALLPFDTKDPKEWAARSPLAFAGSLQCPTRLYRGDQEEFLAATTELMARKAKDAGIDIESQVVPGDHMSAVPRSTELSIEFFQSLK